MKTKKNVFPFTLIVILLLYIGTCCFAEDAQLDSTKKYVEEMGKFDGATCTPSGMTDVEGKKYEVIRVDYEGNLSAYKSHFYVLFSEDGERILMSMPILSFDKNKLDEVMDQVNLLNASTTRVKLYTDEVNCMVMGEMFLLSTPKSMVHISEIGTGIFIGFTDGIYDALKDYAK